MHHQDLQFTILQIYALFVVMTFGRDKFAQKFMLGKNDIFENAYKMVYDMTPKWHILVQKSRNMYHKDL